MVETIENVIVLDLPVLAPDLTLCVTGVEVRGISVDDVPLAHAPTRAAFKSGSFLTEGNTTLVAFNPTKRQAVIDVCV